MIYCRAADKFPVPFVSVKGVKMSAHLSDGQASSEVTLYHLVFFQGGRDKLLRNTVDNIQSQLDEIITTPIGKTHIDLWIESPGGSAHAAYKLNLDLRSRCCCLRAIIPDYAKSAATLLALGADQIFMAPAAELGPLDVQIEHPDREGVIVSGLDVAGSLEFLARTAINLGISGGASIVKITGLPRQGVFHTTFEFMAQFLQPTVGKIDPHLLHQAAQQLKVAEQYAVNMLRKRNLTPNEHMGIDDEKKLMRRLINEYPAHEFVIGREEAKEIGLPVVHAETHPRWDYIKSSYRAFSRGDLGKPSFICVLKDADLEQPAPSAETTQETSHETITQFSEAQPATKSNGSETAINAGA